MPDIGIQIKAVPVVDQKSFNQAVSTYQKMINSNPEAFRIKITADTSSIRNSIRNIQNEFSSLKNIQQNVKMDYNVDALKMHQKEVKFLEEEYVNLKARMAEASKTLYGAAKTTTLNSLQKKIEIIGDAIKRTFTTDELKRFESTLGKVNKLGLFGPEQVLNITQMQDSISGLNARLVELAGTGETVIKVKQVLNDGRWEIVSVKTVDNVKDLENRINNLLNTILKLKTGFGSSNAVLLDLQGFEEQLKQIDVHSKTARSEIDRMAIGIDSLKGKLNGSSGALKQYKTLIRSLTDEQIKLHAEQLKGNSANQQYISSLNSSITQKRNDIKVVEKQIATEEDLAEKNRILQEENARLTKTIGEQNAAAKKQNNLLYNVASGMKDAVARVINYTLAYRALWKAVQLTRESFQIAVELNSAFTDIQMVTMGTTESIRELKDAYAELAVEMSSTLQEVAAGSDEWLRQGKTAEETSELLRSSMVLSKVGAIESADATSYLTSVLNGYKMEVEDAMHVVDAMSQVDIESASSVNDLAIALQRSANTADMAGVSFEKLVGYAATIREVTQKTASTVGESLKTIFSRMGSVAAGKFLDEDLENEYEDFDTFVNDTEKVLTKLGIKLRDTNHQFRDVEDILDEVAQSWNTYNDLEKNALATSIAGVRQRENFIALMENYDKALELTESAYNSNGKAMEKYNIYQDSIEASQQRIQALWEKWVANVNLEGFIKDVLSLGEAFMTLASSDILTFLVRMAPAIMSFAGAMKILQGVLATDAVFMASNGIMSVIMGVARANPVMTVLTIASAVITLVGVLNDLIVTNDELAQSISSLSSEIESNNNEINTYKERLQETSDRINELYKKSESGSLSVVEQEELERLQLENKELENNIMLLEQKNKLAQQEKKEAAEQLYKNSSHIETTVSDGGIITNEVTTLDTRIAEKVRQIEELDNKIRSETDTDKLSEYFNKKDELSSSVIEDIEVAEQILDGVGEDSEIGIKLKEAIDSYYNSIIELKDKAYEIIEDEENEEVVEQIMQFAEAGQLTADVLNNVEFSGFISSLRNMGLNTEDIISIFNELAQTSNQVANSIEKIPVTTMLENVENGISSVVKAQKEMAEAGYVTGDTIKELSEAGYDLSDSLTVTEKGYKINTSALEALLTAQREEYVMAVNESREAAANLIGYKIDEAAAYDDVTNAILAKLEAQMAEAAASANMAMTQMNNAFVSGDTKKADEYSKQWKNYLNTYKQMQSAQADLENSLYNLDLYDSTSKYVKNNTGTNLSSGSSSGSSSNENEETAFEKDIRILEHKLYLAEQWAGVYKDNSEKEIEYQNKINEQVELYNKLMERTHQEAEAYRKKGYSEESEEIQDLQKQYWEYYNAKKDLVDDYNSYLEDKIQEQKDAAEDAIDKVKNALQDLVDDALDEIQKKMDEIDEKMEEENEYYDYRIKQLEAIRDLTEQYHDIVNQVNSGLHEIEMELESSKSSYEYMDESLRDTIFNDDDYNKLSEKLNGIAAESKELYDSYLDELSTLTEDEIYKADIITKEFERQFQYKMLEYQLAEKELNLAKAQTVLQNTLANRNVRMFKDGRWIWTADHEAVEEAKKDVEEAEYEKKEAEIAIKQQEIIDKYESMIEGLEMQQKESEAKYEAMKEELEEEYRALEEQWEYVQDRLTTESDSMQTLLETINNTNIPEFQEVISSVGDSLEDLIDRISGIGSSSSGGGGGSSHSGGSSINGGYEFSPGGWTEDEMNEGFIPAYDNGGVLKGIGGIKATKKDEVVFDENISSMLLSPVRSKQFLDSANALTQILNNSEKLSKILGAINVQPRTIQNNDSHNIYIDGASFGKMSNSDMDAITSILRRYIPISKG